MKFILGKKIGMTQIFDETGKVNPVTLIEASGNKVTQVLKEDKNGRNAVQIGFGSKKLNKPQAGHVKEFTDKNNRGFVVLKEFTPSEEQKLKKGDSVSVDQFKVGDKVVVSGVSKGKGFQGVVKRWNFSGAPKTHGTKHTLRTGGSIGSAYPQRVMKARKMPGRMGSQRVSVKNLKVIHIDAKKNLIAVRGAVPGKNGTYLEIKSQ